ncbi:dual specificity protein kinase Ttk-like isoform X2 [Ornithodoros turicata]|uniref:dual specificity protein kinase Ttk-like isoform X2 n=1 Tax=Ornithodoros turicata TaxID=34597 RepID=UPI003138DC4F
MTEEKFSCKTFLASLSRDARVVSDDGIAIPSAESLQDVKENLPVPGTPVKSSEASVTRPIATKSALCTISDILNMKTPEFRPCVPCSKTKQVLSDEMPATGARKKLYSCLVPSCSANATEEREKSSGIPSNLSVKKVQKEYIPPLLRKIRENPSMVKNAMLDLQLLRSSEDDEECEEDAENINVAKKKDDYQSETRGRSYIPGTSAERRYKSKRVTKHSAEQRSAGNSSGARVPDKQPPRIPPRSSPHRASRPDKGLLDHRQSENALKPHNSGEETYIKVNGKYYDIFSVIGSGGSSKVYHVFDAKKHEFAVKFVNLEEANEEVTAIFLNEVTILKRLKRCQRVVRLYDYEFCNKRKMLSLVMEKGDTDLSGVLRSIMHADSLSPINVKYYWSEMLYAVAEIHERGIIHSDLKPANFLIVKGTLKLIDFGIADTIQADATSVVRSCQMGTLNFMSPESINSEISDTTGCHDIKVNTKSDVWSLGCILYALVYGKPPFQDLKSTALKLHAIKNSKHPIPFPEIEDHHLLDVLQQCLQRNPKKRPTIAELLQHPYLTEGRSGAASTEPGLAALINDIEQLSPRSFHKVARFVRALRRK